MTPGEHQSKENGTEHSPASGPESRLRSAPDLFADFIALEDAGERIDFERWLAGHPDRASELRALHAVWRDVEAEMRQALGDARAGDWRFHRPESERSGSRPALANLDVKSGDVIGDYRLVERIGQGGMGQVWEAEQLSLRRKVALKLLSSGTEASRRVLRRFEQEALAGGRLNHPAIVGVYAFDCDGTVPFIAQELVPGSYSLADFIADTRASGDLPQDYYRRIADLFARIAEALQVAHDAGVVHRDLKPQNILITPRDEPKVADFGLAELTDLTGATETGELAGTYCYMSPEQAMSRRMGIDHRTDIFSLGATLYELLTFTRAFDGDTRQQIAEKVLFHDPPNPRDVRSKVPTDMALICLKAIEKRRSDRYGSMADFAADLRRFLGHEPIHARPPHVWQRLYKWVARHPTASSLMALGSSALLVVALLLAQTARARAEAERFAYRAHIALAERAMRRGQFDEARREIARATELEPASPTANLVLAAGLASLGRFSEASREVDEAARRGFDPDGPVADTALAHFHRGLVLVSRDRTQAAYSAAARELARALELDPGLSSALFPLYVARFSIGDHEGALSALDACIEDVGAFETFLVGLRQEATGAYDEASATFEALAARPGLDTETVDALRLARALGRTYLRAERPDLAARHLARAVEAHPDDAASWANLSLAYLQVHFDGDAGALASAEEAARRAAESELMVRTATPCLVWTLTRKFEIEGDTAALDEAQRLVDSARASGATVQGGVDSLEADVLLARAGALRTAGRFDEVRDLLARCVEIDPDNVVARVNLAQELWHADEPQAALEHLEHALGVWASQPESPRGGLLRPGHLVALNRKWFHAAHTWTFGACVSLGEVPRGQASRAVLEEELDSGRFESPEELVAFARFLCFPVPELQDCALARRVTAQHDLRGQLRGNEEAARILDEIEEICR